MLKVFHEHDRTGNENDASSIDDKKINWDFLNVKIII